ncbi:alkene reductase [Dokdonia sp. R86516]|uniref:alkene reductase n=1 Tax=Dokdonia sp. R86516 TaxID=3093856 RepID=UPI0037CBE44B
MKDYKELLSPLKTEHFSLKNKVVMAPLTRSRSTAGHIPTDIMIQYYGERAGAGLIITEGTSPSLNGVGYPRIPGIYSREQVKAWTPVAAAVHKNDGKIFMQLMHSGRISHPDNMSEEAVIFAPSAIRPEETKMYVDGKGELSIPEPTAMTVEDIENTIEEYVTAAKNAIKAGFDGVEVHSANGYLLDQFLNTGTNKRDDHYGGSVENRCRFTLEVTERVIAAIGKEKVGIRLSPNGAMNDLGPFDSQKETFDYLSAKLEELAPVYIHLVNHESMGAPGLPADIQKNIRDRFSGLLILSGGYDAAKANQDLMDNKGDLVAFGRNFYSKPRFSKAF